MPITFSAFINNMAFENKCKEIAEVLGLESKKECNELAQKIAKELVESHKDAILQLATVEQEKQYKDNIPETHVFTKLGKIANGVGKVVLNTREVTSAEKLASYISTNIGANLLYGPEKISKKSSYFAEVSTKPTGTYFGRNSDVMIDRGGLILSISSKHLLGSNHVQPTKDFPKEQEAQFLLAKIKTEILDMEWKMGPYDGQKLTDVKHNGKQVSDTHLHHEQWEKVENKDDKDLLNNNVNGMG